MKIILATDNPDTKKLIENIITAEDSLVIVSDGTKVVENINSNDADIILSDLQVSNMGGFAIALEVEMEQEMDRCKLVPILLLLDKVSDTFLANRTSCDYIIKPFSVFEIREKIEELCSGR